MLKLNFQFVILSIFMLSACSSTPKVNYTPAGQHYFASNPIKYSGVDISVTSKDESKAIQSGYMSNEAVNQYVGTKIDSYLKKNHLFSDDGIKIKIKFNIERIYSWGGSSMSIFGYFAHISLENKDLALANYNDSGQLKDDSIAGNFKTVFAKNDPSEENQYIDVAINFILAKLPK